VAALHHRRFHAGPNLWDHVKISMNLRLARYKACQQKILVRFQSYVNLFYPDRGIPHSAGLTPFDSDRYYRHPDREVNWQIAILCTQIVNPLQCAIEMPIEE
jgi:hypothetical protein